MLSPHERFFRGKAARAAMAPTLSPPPPHFRQVLLYYCVRGPSEPRDICAGCSNTICSSVVADGGDALRHNAS